MDSIFNPDRFLKEGKLNPAVSNMVAGTCHVVNMCWQAFQNLSRKTWLSHLSGSFALRSWLRLQSARRAWEWPFRGIWGSISVSGNNFGSASIPFLCSVKACGKYAHSGASLLRRVTLLYSACTLLLSLCWMICVSSRTDHCITPRYYPPCCPIVLQVASFVLYPKRLHSSYTRLDRNLASLAAFYSYCYERLVTCWLLDHQEALIHILKISFLIHR